MGNSISIFDCHGVIDALAGTGLEYFADIWIKRSHEIFADRYHGDREKWSAVIAHLPAIQADRVELCRRQITAESANRIDDSILCELESGLLKLHPWRKGPFNLFGVEIDSEWRSDLKWDRIRGQISPLNGRKVLDVGCGNGYYLLRMLGAGAKMAMGIDPTHLFIAQFAAINRYIGAPGVFILPMKSEDLITTWEPVDGDGFDTVFSMGIFYHRRSPISHLEELFAFLRPGGELVLETLIIDGDSDSELVPETRYAQMRNVWTLPTVVRLERMLSGAGFEGVRLVSKARTTPKEQRKTRWMQFDSLTDFLDPDSPELTIEGYQAPLRACMIAMRPETG